MFNFFCLWLPMIVCKKMSAYSRQAVWPARRNIYVNVFFYYIDILFQNILFDIILFYSVLFYWLLFWNILLDIILFYSVLFYWLLFQNILLDIILFYSVLFYSILFYSRILCLILFYSVYLGEKDRSVFPTYISLHLWSLRSIFLHQISCHRGSPFYWVNKQINLLLDFYWLNYALKQFT